MVGNKWLMLGAVLSALAAIVHLGVIVGGPGETTFKFSDLTESFVGQLGDNLFGYGRVTAVDDNRVDVDFEKSDPKRVMDSFLERP